MLEPKTLKMTPVPDPTRVRPLDMRHLLDLVARRLLASKSQGLEIEKQIDQLVSTLYGLTAHERSALGVED